MYQINFYVPTEYAEKVKEAMFAAGAGRMGQYDCCAYQSAGVGQFRPLLGSRPFIGKVDQVERVEEVRVEMVCASTYLAPAIQALKGNHPYETPAFFVLKGEDFSFPSG